MTDDGRNVYISTFSRGFCVYDPITRKLKNYVHGGMDGKGSLCNNWVMCMMPDRNGRIWLGTASGVSCFNPSDGDFRSLGLNLTVNYKKFMTTIFISHNANGHSQKHL